MEHPFLIVSGYSNTARSAAEKQAFANIWSWNTPYPAVIVDNAEVPLRLDNRPDIQIIRTGNLGHHYHHFKGKSDPHLGGWSVAWLLGGWVAYSARKDMLYKEQDCLCFGEWVRHIYQGANHEGKNDVLFGMGSNQSCEQSLFWVRWSAIPRFFAAYCNLPDGDGVMLTEDKFTALASLEGNPLRMAAFTMDGGRKRPLPVGETWYAQQLTQEELSDVLSTCPVYPR